MIKGAFTTLRSDQKVDVMVRVAATFSKEEQEALVKKFTARFSSGDAENSKSNLSDNVTQLLIRSRRG